MFKYIILIIIFFSLVGTWYYYNIYFSEYGIPIEEFLAANSMKKIAEEFDPKDIDDKLSELNQSITSSRCLYHYSFNRDDGFIESVPTVDESYRYGLFGRCMRLNFSKIKWPCFNININDNPTFLMYFNDRRATYKKYSATPIMVRIQVKN